uniref:Uncharacterized protein LOC104212915 n=1 Tax=Nicotiana sylvestris TaxID=4096 RepID=A0A1U7V2I1_NICSY|nr:PREDICTED: uncharacterized protein LOC104212915 [Nicotiana sylvestris]
MVDNYKQWNEKMSFALLGYRTTVHTSYGATLYLLVYGTKVVIPVEVEIPSLRIIQEAELNDAEWVRSWYEQLDIIHWKRMNAICHGQHTRTEWQEHQQKGQVEAIHTGAIGIEANLPTSG